MSAAPQHTNRATPAQADDAHQPIFLDHRWQHEIMPLLPTGWAEQAHQLGAFSRVRNLAAPQMLLRALLAYALVRVRA